VRSVNGAKLLAHKATKSARARVFSPRSMPGAAKARARKSIAMLADSVMRNSTRCCTPHRTTPAADPAPRARANIRFLAIEDAWFSGSMNYLGRARNADGSPQYEATYEINAALEISLPEFMQLVSHEVVPGHVTTFALDPAFIRAAGSASNRPCHDEYPWRSAVRGIANKCDLMAAASLKWNNCRIDLQLARCSRCCRRRQEPVVLPHLGQAGRWKSAGRAARDYLCSDERADKLSARGSTSTAGRMYLPAYRAGTEKVAALRRRHPPEQCCRRSTERRAWSTSSRSTWSADAVAHPDRQRGA